MKHFIFTFLLLAHSLLFAQDGKITGKILDSNGLPVDAATVMVLSGETIVNGAITDDQGIFSIQPVEPGTYKVKIEYLYSKKEITGVTVLAGSTRDLGTIQFQNEENGVALKEEAIIEFKNPVFEKSREQGRTFDAKEVRNLGTRNVRKVAATTPGVYSGDKGGELLVTVKNNSPENISGETHKSELKAKKKKGNRKQEPDPINNEHYSLIVENQFKSPKDEPLSTFSADVDRAAYSNIRRFIDAGQEVPKDAVRIEEMINYFPYNYPQPKDENPVFINAEYSACPWNHQNSLLRVAFKAKEIEVAQTPPLNLVFLIDVSGSMSDVDKLPLLKEGLSLLVNNLRQEDKVAIVVYAGAAGLVLPSTSGGDKATILAALNNLQAGGSTAGGAGIELAYKIAQEKMLENGNNRVILATDGDFNVGISSINDLTRFIEEKRKTGIFLTCLGFGSDSYNDDVNVNVMETLADKGNGNYAYIDDIKEAKKIFGEELTGTLVTVAKDVKIQVEFNPKLVASYRLVGYENRMLNVEDFKDDKKDAGEVGAGHCVTALYEIIPATKNTLKEDTNLRYQTKVETEKASMGNEIALIKLRYKLPKESKSVEIQQIVPYQNIRWSDGSESYLTASEDFRFAASVAMWGLCLRKSPFVKEGNKQTVLKWAEMSKGSDKGGYRAEYIEMVKKDKE